jgi:hypothetical protein
MMARGALNGSIMVLKSASNAAGAAPGNRAAEVRTDYGNIDQVIGFEKFVKIGLG